MILLPLYLMHLSVYFASVITIESYLWDLHDNQDVVSVLDDILSNEETLSFEYTAHSE